MQCTRCGTRQAEVHDVWHRFDRIGRDATREREGLCDDCYAKFLHFLDGNDVLRTVPVEDAVERPTEFGVDQVE